ncbi:hypothetical protein BB560_003475 [Smittium megazygosporum]|uniref:ubiquitinyl hydrolase 1 n=1 Tax=Smittium megazygosporum TaxID=133381 RepID=A0A2T9ZBV8_9FUNG|nr:hypothetical protein BB560_003475 [Smittium megazygosporum]
MDDSICSSLEKEGNDTRRKRMRPNRTLEIPRHMLKDPDSLNLNEKISKSRLLELELDRICFEVPFIMNKTLSFSGCLFLFFEDILLSESHDFSESHILYMVDFEWLINFQKLLKEKKPTESKVKHLSEIPDYLMFLKKTDYSIQTKNLIQVFHSILSDGIMQETKIGFIHKPVWDILVRIFVNSNVYILQEVHIQKNNTAYEFDLKNLEFVFHSDYSPDSPASYCCITNWDDIMKYYNKNNELSGPFPSVYEESMLSILHKDLTNYLELENMKSLISESTNTNEDKGRDQNKTAGFDNSEELEINWVEPTKPTDIANINSLSLTNELNRKLTVSSHNINSNNSDVLRTRPISNHSSNSDSIHNNLDVPTNPSSSVSSISLENESVTPFVSLGIDVQPTVPMLDSNLDYPIPHFTSLSTETRSTYSQSLNMEIENPSAVHSPMQNDFDNSTSTFAEQNTDTHSTEHKQVKPGLCGLVNLGNTCYMNSALQCLSNIKELTNYFISSAYKSEINRDNPIGMSGLFADEYNNLLLNLWSKQNESYAPRQFKVTIGRFLTQFAGYQQQDAPEFLSLFLDGLHEDLNRILKKPYIELQDSGERPDFEVSNEQWDAYKQRNDSIIVDLFQGQLKSSVTCPVCDKRSTVFDPFMYLTLLLPSDHSICLNILFVPSDFKIRPTWIQLTADNRNSILHLKDTISRLTRVNTEHILLSETFMGRTFKIYDNNDPLQNLEGQIVYSANEVVSQSDPYTPKKQATIQVLFSELDEDDTSSKERSFRGFESPVLFGHPVLLTLYGDSDFSSPAEDGAIVAKLALVYKSIIQSLNQWIDPKYASLLDFFSKSFETFLSSSSGLLDDTGLTNSESKLLIDALSTILTLIRLSIYNPGPQPGIDSSFLGPGRTLSEIGHVSSSPAIVAINPFGGSSVDNVVNSQSFKKFEKKVMHRDLKKLPIEFKENIIKTPSALSNDDKSEEIDILDIEAEDSTSGHLLSTFNSDVVLSNGDTIVCELNLTVLGELLNKFISDNVEPGNYLSDIWKWNKHPYFPFSTYSSLHHKKRKNLKKNTNFEATSSDVEPSQVEFPTIKTILSNDCKSFESEFKTLEQINNIEKKSDNVGTIDIYDCLHEFISEEQLDEQESWHCSNCREFRQAKKKLDLWRLPKVLIIHLKRFDHSKAWSKKINTFVDFPLEGLELKDFLVGNNYGTNWDDFSQENLLPHNTVYDLYATCNHFGGYGGGHYTASVLHSDTNQWHYYNDSHVSRILDPAKEVINESAYVLFYKSRTLESSEIYTKILQKKLLEDIDSTEIGMKLDSNSIPLNIPQDSNEEHDSLSHTLMDDLPKFSQIPTERSITEKSTAIILRNTDSTSFTYVSLYDNKNMPAVPNSNSLEHLDSGADILVLNALETPELNAGSVKNAGESNFYEEENDTLDLVKAQKVENTKVMQHQDEKSPLEIPKITKDIAESNDSSLAELSKSFGFIQSGENITVVDSKEFPNDTTQRDYNYYDQDRKCTYENKNDVFSSSLKLENRARSFSNISCSRKEKFDYQR